jgi:pimeloyl-ACP methyl ester carboxylesterase
MIDASQGGRYAEVSGVRIFYREAGDDGVPLVLLHGWTGHSFQWRKMIPALAGACRVYALDLPGCGFSDKPDIRYTMKELVDFVHGFVHKLDLAPCVLAGTSHGGFVAVRYGLDHPEDVRGLVLLTSSGLKVKYPLVLRVCFLPVVRYLVPYLLLVPRDLKLWIRARVHPRTERHRTLLADHVVATRSLRSWPGLRAAMRILTSITAADLVDDRLGAIRCPTLVLWGDRDETLSPAMAEIFQKKIPNCRLRWLEGCGHNVPEERPEESASHILEFLRELI